MSSIHSISPDRLVRLIGTPKCPTLVYVRPDEEFTVDPRLVPGSIRRAHDAALVWAAELRGQSAVLICSDGLGVSAGVVVLSRDASVSAETLEYGFAGWIKSGLPCIPTTKLARRNPQGRPLWVTRRRPKIDRIAAPRLNGIARPQASRATGRSSYTRNDRSRQCQGAIPPFRGVSKCNDAAPSPP
jgi:hypothetical protein